MLIFRQAPRRIRKTTLTKSFILFIKNLNGWPKESSSAHYDLKLKNKQRILVWADTIDDEILLVVGDLVRMKKNRSGIKGITMAWVSAHMNPLGAGRSANDLVNVLLDVGILSPSTEIVRERTYAALDAKANPAWDLGRMFYDAWPYVELFELHAKLG